MFCKRKDINGRTIFVIHRRRTWKDVLGARDCKPSVRKWLINYKNDTKCIEVDQQAPEWYIDLTYIHEAIKAGHLPELDDLIRPTTNGATTQDQPITDEEIEKFVREIAGEHADEYFTNRAAMLAEREKIGKIN